MQIQFQYHVSKFKWGKKKKILVLHDAFEGLSNGAIVPVVLASHTPQLWLGHVPLMRKCLIL